MLAWVPERWRSLSDDVCNVIGLVELTHIICLYCVPIMQFHRLDKPDIAPTVDGHLSERNGACEYDSTFPIGALGKRPWCLEVFPPPSTGSNVTQLAVLTVSLSHANHDRPFVSWHSPLTAGSHRVLMHPVIFEYSSKYIVKFQGKHECSSWVDCKQTISDQVPTRLEFTDRVECIMGQERFQLGLVSDFSNHIIRIDLYRYQLHDNNLEHPRIVVTYM